jgi:hypothetical protein
MRNLFLALVLANLAFAAWHNWFTPNATAPRAADPDVPGILLASEFEAPPRPLRPAPDVPELPEEAIDTVVAVEPEIPDEPADTGREAVAESAAVAAVPPPLPAPPADGAPSTCISIGPFRELAQAATAAANLRTGGYEPVQRVGEGDIWVGYWVYIAAIPTPSRAQEILASLHQNGISDSYVIPNSDSGSLISLGVFTEVARAGNRLTAVRELGYEATIADRTRRATVYWVDVLLGEGQTLDFESFQPPGRIIRLEQRPCDRAYE